MASSRVDYLAERWRALLRRAQHRGCFVGVDEKAYPADFAVYTRDHPALRNIPGRWPMPPPLRWAQFEAFLRESGADRRLGVVIRDKSAA